MEQLPPATPSNKSDQRERERMGEKGRAISKHSLHVRVDDGTIIKTTVPYDRSSMYEALQATHSRNECDDE
jgi:hypothetical protein